MHNDIETILKLANMLSKTLGKFMQITVSDTQKRIMVENVIEDESYIDGSLSDNEKYFLQDNEIKRLPFVANYKSISENNTKLRSSTFFFKDQAGNIEYLLSFTTNVDKFIYISEIFDIFINGNSKLIKSEEVDKKTSVDQLPKLNLSIHDIIDTVVHEGQRRYGIFVERMTKKEKESLIREIHSRGAFLIKGSVTEVASKLNYSESTIYRFLQQLEEE